MTITTNLSAETLDGNGSTTSFPFSFRVFTVDQLQAWITDSEGVVTQTTDFSVVLTDSGGTVTYPVVGTTKLPSGSTITIMRNMEFTQPVDLVNATTFHAEVIEDALDNLTMQIQQVKETADRAVQYPSGTAAEDALGAADFLEATTANAAACAAAETAAETAQGLAEDARDAALAAATNAKWLSDFGAVGDGTTDDTVAVQAAIDWAKANGRLVYAKAGTYKITDELDCFLAAPGGSWGIIGEAWLNTIFNCNFNGYDKAVFKGWTAVGLAAGTRCAAPVLENIRVTYSSNYNPMAFDFRGAGNFRPRNLSVANSNNTQFRLTCATNSDGDNLVCYGGGRTFSYKDSTGITFSITIAETALTCSEAHFVAGDVGKAIYLEYGSNSEMFIIAAYVSATEVTVATAAQRTFSAVPGVWDGATCAMTATDATLTANSSVFSASDVGLTVYVQGADTDGGLLRAKIASYTSATEVELDTVAVTTITEGYFTVPAVVFDKDDAFADYDGVTNDLTYPNIQVEGFDGVGIVWRGQSRAHFPQFKSHALPIPTHAHKSLACVWADKARIYIDGVVEGNPINRQAKIYAANIDGLLSIGRLDCVLAQSEKLCWEENNGTDGFVAFGDIYVVNAVSGVSLLAMFRNASATDPRIVVRGVAISNARAPYTYPRNIKIGSTHAASAGDLSLHIAMYGTTYGFNTTSGVLAAVVSQTTGNFSVVNSVGTTLFKQAAAATYFPVITTTASAANAFLDSGSTPANSLLRSTSALKYKTDIETLAPEYADKVLDLRPVYYRSLAEADPKAWSYYGLIAEEVAEIEPRLVHYAYDRDDYEDVADVDEEGNPTTRKVLKDGAQKKPDGVQYERLAVLLLDVVKRLEARVAELENKIA